MSVFSLKIISVISMFLDHYNYTIFPRQIYFSYIGRLAFPIFAFLISQGYIHTKNLKKYFIRLLLCAFISQIPFHLLFKTESLNTIFTLILGLLCIYTYDKTYTWLKQRNKYTLCSFIIPLLIILLGSIIRTDYGSFGICLIFIFYLFRKSKIISTIASILLIVIHYFYRYYGAPLNIYLPTMLFTIIPIFIIIFYNNKKGINMKYIFYIFYPLHLTLLYILTLSR